MKPTIQNRINSLKALSAANADNVTIRPTVRSANDNLSKAIRNKKEAEIFKSELQIALKLAKK